MKNKKPVVVSTPEVQRTRQGQGPGQLIAAQQFSGPIPSPETFRQYGQVVPDAPERILKVFELDSEHTRNMQLTALKAETARDTRAQWMPLLLCCLPWD